MSESQEHYQGAAAVALARVDALAEGAHHAVVELAAVDAQARLQRHRAQFAVARCRRRSLAVCRASLQFDYMDWAPHAPLVRPQPATRTVTLSLCCRLSPACGSATGDTVLPMVTQQSSSISATSYEKPAPATRLR